MEDENIIWQEINSVSFQNKPKEQIALEPCKMDYYISLYVELIEKCNPKNFMLPYDKEKIDMANEFYQQLLNTPEENEINIRQMRNKAIERLGITISTKRLYEKLINYCNPAKFMDPYDFNAVQIANHYYPLIEEYRNDIWKLEKLNDEIFQNELLQTYYKKIDKRKREMDRKAQQKRDWEEDERFLILMLLLGGVLIVAFILFNT